MAYRVHHVGTSRRRLLNSLLLLVMHTASVSAPKSNPPFLEPTELLL